MKHTNIPEEHSEKLSRLGSDAQALRPALSEGPGAAHLDQALRAVNVGHYEDVIELWEVYGES